MNNADNNDKKMYKNDASLSARSISSNPNPARA